MKRNLEQVALAAVCIGTIMLTMISCNKQEKNQSKLDYLAVQASSSSWSIIDKDGKEIVKEEYPSDALISPFYNEAYWVKSDDKYQLYNLSDPKKPVIEEEFAKATTFGAGVAVVSNPNQQIRIIDTKGTTIATLGKDIKRCHPFIEEGYAIVENADGLRGIVDTKGNILIKPSYSFLKLSQDGTLLSLKTNDDKNIQITDIKGKKLGEINTEKYDLRNERFYEDKIIVTEANNDDAHFIVLDKTGKKIFDIKKAKGINRNSFYIDGFITFDNGEGKMGVADDQGEIVIRPKYEDIYNYGEGLFAVKKNDKWGIINDKDDTIIEFDYDGVCFFMMSSNYIMRDGNSWSLISKEGKEITSFDGYSYYSDIYAEYVDVEGLANGVYKTISEYEQGLTASQLAKKLSLDIDKFHYSSRIESNQTINDKLSIDYTLWYDGYLAEEKTHEEEVNDGWFTTRHTISDGWQWTNNSPNSIFGRLTLNDSSINIKDIQKSLLSKLSDGRKKISDGVFSKSIKIDGKTVECKTAVTLSEGVLSFNITFNK